MKFRRLENLIGASSLEKLKNSTILVIGFKERIETINEECNIITYNLKIDDINIKDIFNTKIDFVVDAVDDVKAKIAIINYCLNNNIDFISSMGTGNRLDPSKLTITKLDKTYNDPLARIMRSKFDKRVQKKITVCTSIELPLKVIDKSFVGSTAFVPSSAGLLIASYVVRKLI